MVTAWRLLSVIDRMWFVFPWLLWKKRKFWHDERIEKQLVISFHLYGLNSRTNSFFSAKSNCLETKPRIQGYAITGKFVCFCVSAKCPKHSFLIMSLKKRKKILVTTLCHLQAHLLSHPIAPVWNSSFQTLCRRGNFSTLIALFPTRPLPCPGSPTSGDGGW